MDDLRRHRLAERKQMLQLRLRRQVESETFRSVAGPLCAAGVRFSKIPPERNRVVLGPLIAGPGQDEELDFGWMPEAQTSLWSSDAQRDTLCRWALAAVAAPDERIAIIWHPVRAGLSLRRQDAATHIALLLDAGRGDTIWIASAAGGAWLIQIGFWSSTVSFA